MEGKYHDVWMVTGGMQYRGDDCSPGWLLASTAMPGNTEGRRWIDLSTTPRGILHRRVVAVLLTGTVNGRETICLNGVVRFSNVLSWGWWYETTLTALGWHLYSWKLPKVNIRLWYKGVSLTLKVGFNITWMMKPPWLQLDTQNECLCWQIRFTLIYFQKWSTSLKSLNGF